MAERSWLPHPHRQDLRTGTLHRILTNTVYRAASGSSIRFQNPEGANSRE